MYVYMSVWVYAIYTPGICGDQETASDFLELELQEAVSCLWTQLRSLEKTASDFYRWTISWATASPSFKAMVVLSSPGCPQTLSSLGNLPASTSKCWN